jgi:hypothetical protein
MKNGAVGSFGCSCLRHIVCANCQAVNHHKWNAWVKQWQITLNSYTGFIDGLKDGAHVSLEGYASTPSLEGVRTGKDVSRRHGW